MSLRDFNEPSRPLNTDPAGNGTGLNAFHTTHPEERQPSHVPQIIGGIAVALMVGAAAIGLYAYSGSSHPTSELASNANPAPAPAPAAAPAPAPQQAANMPADTTPPATTTTDNSAPTPAPMNEASTKRTGHRHQVTSREPGESRSASASNSGASTNGQAASDGMAARMSADSTQTSQAPAQQNAVQPPSQQGSTAQQTTPLPSAPQPSPSDIATNKTQSGQAVPQGSSTASDMPAQNSAPQQQPAQPATPQPDASAQQTAPAAQ